MNRTAESSTRKFSSIAIPEKMPIRNSLMNSFILFNVERFESGREPQLLAAGNPGKNARAVMYSSANKHSGCVWKFEEAKNKNSYYIKNTGSDLYLMTEDDFEILLGENPYPWIVAIDLLNEIVQINTSDGRMAIAADKADRLKLSGNVNIDGAADRKWKYIFAG